MLSRVFGFGRRPFESLSEQEILALAISSEEDDGRIYRAYAEGLAESFPQSAKVFEAMALEEDGHRDSLIELYRKRFGERIPLLRREHVKGYYERKPDWLVRPLGVENVRRQAEAMEQQAYRFYVEAAKAPATLRPENCSTTSRRRSKAMRIRRIGWSRNLCRAPSRTRRQAPSSVSSS